MFLSMRIARLKYAISVLQGLYGIKLDPPVLTKKLKKSKAEQASYLKLIMLLFKIRNMESLNIKHHKSKSRLLRSSRLKELSRAMALKPDNLKYRKNNHLI
jgi:hypothetical protein